MIKEKIEAMKAILEDANVNAVKFENGNKAAGTRLRKCMQDLKAKAQEVRLDVIDVKNELKTK